MILVAIEEVQPGMPVGVGVRNREGHTLLGPGVRLTPDYIGRLRALGYRAIWIDDEDTRDIPYDDALTEPTRRASTAAIEDTFALTARETERARSLSLDEVRRALEGRRLQQALQDSGIVERLAGSVDLVVDEVVDRAVLSGLSSLRTHNTYVFQHCLDVAITATVIGRILGYDRDTLRKLASGCMLHDVGALFLDASMLERPGPLTPAETARVREHPLLGYLLLRDTLRLGVLPPHIAYQHHEQQDGHGYPRALSGTNRLMQGAETHMPGRIMALGEIAAVADFHDACSSDRPWRPRYAPDVVWRMVREAAGARLNREVVERFLAVLPPYPLGTQVRVTSGAYKDHVGVVARVRPPSLARPVVRLLVNPGGERIPPIELDLTRDDATIRGVVGAASLPAAVSAS